MRWLYLDGILFYTKSNTIFNYWSEFRLSSSVLYFYIMLWTATFQRNMLSPSSGLKLIVRMYLCCRNDTRKVITWIHGKGTGHIPQSGPIGRVNRDQIRIYVTLLLHGVTIQETTIWILTAMRPGNLIRSQLQESLHVLEIK
jgi:hypothetical protein